jgi:hypothetical protein
MRILVVSGTFAVDVLARGASPYDVAKLLGDTIETVEKHYADVVKDRCARPLNDGKQDGRSSSLQQHRKPALRNREERRQLAASLWHDFSRLSLTY